MEDELKDYKSDYSTVALVRDVLALIHPYRWKFWSATFLRFTSDLVWLYPAYALAFIVTFLTEYSPGDSLEPLLWIIGLWIIASIWHYVTEELSNYIGYKVSERTGLDAQLNTMEHMLLLDLSWHERENSGNKLKRIQKGGADINYVLRIWLDNIIQIAVSLVGMLVIIAIFDLLIAGLLLFFLTSFFVVSHFFTKKAGSHANLTNIMEERLHGVAFETINNIRSVKVLGMGPGLLGIVCDRVTDLYNAVRQRIFWFRTRQVILNLWGQTFRLGVSLFIVWGILHGHYEVGFLILFYNYFNYLWENVERLSFVLLDFIISKYGIGRMMEILHEPVNIDREHGKRDFPKNWKTIRMEGISFGYGEKNVLDNISLEIQRGERVGIVGVSGGGKSTLFKLLLKEHEDYDGRILFDDVPLRDIKRTSYFLCSAVVLQDTEVFNFTLRDNVSLANREQKDNEKLLDQAIQVSHVTDFMHKLPKGLDTYIGEKGVRLSGGEKQRVGIARAIFKQPDILFLDEATSHLDIESEEKIKDSLHHFFQEVTAVVIAHRLSTIKEMDRIIVLEDGKIIEEGSFDDLYSRKGRFYELWEKQKF